MPYISTKRSYCKKKVSYGEALSPTTHRVGHSGKNTTKCQNQARKGTMSQNIIGGGHNGQGKEAAQKISTHF
jgi:hypothetical protein